MIFQCLHFGLQEAVSLTLPSVVIFAPSYTPSMLPTWSTVVGVNVVVCTRDTFSPSLERRHSQRPTLAPAKTDQAARFCLNSGPLFIKMYRAQNMGGGEGVGVRFGGGVVLPQVMRCINKYGLTMSVNSSV